MASPASDPTASQLAPRDFSATTQQGRAYLQARIGLFARAMTILMLVYLSFIIVVRLVFRTVVPGASWLSAVVGVSALLWMAALWWIAKRPTHSARRVTMMDFSCVGDIGGLIALNTYLMRDVAFAPFAGFVGVSFVVFGRALIVPSTGRRTVLVSTMGVSSIIGATVLIAWVSPEVLIVPPALQISLIVMWSAVVVALSSYGSAVIYGLREEVREAKRLGAYTLVSKIGEGGMGVVYRACHALLRRPTAIKLLKPERSNPEQLRRFEREVQHTAQLTHPNTIQIYDYGHTADGVFYYAMELLDGMDLQSLVDDYGPQQPARVVHIMRQICGALGEAHQQGLVHRDIKPANIVLCKRGGCTDVVKVLDYGLVKEIGKSDALMTDLNVVTGTPAYLSPEAITAPGEVGPAADLYALGAVGYFLLTGEPVFEGATVVEICGHHVHSTPEAPSKRLGAPLPEGLEALLLQCLEKQPGARPESALLLRDALEDLTDVKRWTEADGQAFWKQVPQADDVHDDLASRACED